MNPIDQKLQNDIVQEINSFLGGLDQMKFGFGVKIQQAVQPIFMELEKRDETIKQLTGQNAELIKQVSDLQQKILALTPMEKSEG